MGLPPTYKKNAPDGYKEHLKYQPGDEKTNTKEDFTAFTKEVGDLASVLSA